MKKIKFISIVACLLGVLFVVNSANADLNLLGQGTSTHGTYNLIYDTDFDITWYDYTNTHVAWQNQLDWASGLTVNFGDNTYTDWRLPATVDGLFVFGYDGTTTAGYNITTSEMGHLFYTALGNEGYYDTSGNRTSCTANSPFCLTKTGDFQNLIAHDYWSGTDNAADRTSGAWYFSTMFGNHEVGNKDGGWFGHYGIAVMDGKAMAVVPEPISSTLFIVGGATLGFRRWRKR